MNLKETLLLEGKKYENYFEEKKNGKFSELFKKFFSNEHTLRRYIMASDPTANVDYTGNYTDWILKQMDSENKRIGGASKDRMLYIASDIKRTLKYFDKNKMNFKFQDINKYSFRDIEEEKEKLENDKATIKMKGATPTFEHGPWKIIEIKNHQQACNLGRGSKWCITSKQYPEEYYKYAKHGPIFFVVKGNRRWATTGRVPQTQVFGIWDERDAVVDKKKWKSENEVPPEVYLYLTKRYINKNGE